MSEKQLKKMLDFSKNYIPPGWRPFLVGDFNSLCYIGRENLTAMLRDWEMTLLTSKVVIDRISKTNDESETAMSWLEYRKTMCERARKAIPHFKKILKDAESKPIFCNHRPLDYFKFNQPVFACVEHDDGSISDYVRGTVCGLVSNSIVVRLDENPELVGEIGIRSPFVLSESEAEFLTRDSNYLLLYSKMCGFKNEGEITFFEDLVVECGIKFFTKNCFVDDGKSPNIFFPVFSD